MLSAACDGAAPRLEIKRAWRVLVFSLSVFSLRQVLTQLYDDIVTWSASLGVQLATHPVPPLRQLGLSLQPTSWSVKDVCKVLKAVGLGEYMELFVEHRVQGDVLFNLTEENLKEMGIEKVGDRLLIADIVQTLYEQVTRSHEITRDHTRSRELCTSR